MAVYNRTETKTETDERTYGLSFAFDDDEDDERYDRDDATLLEIINIILSIPQHRRKEISVIEIEGD